MGEVVAFVEGLGSFFHILAAGVAVVAFNGHTRKLEKWRFLGDLLLAFLFAGAVAATVYFYVLAFEVHNASKAVLG